MKYYLKIDKEVYGPLSLSEAQEWAADGRVGHEDAISTAKEGPWQPCTEKPELGMEWLVVYDNKTTFGPLHPLAFASAMHEGSLAADTQVRHKDSTETFSLVEVLCAALLENKRYLEERLEQGPSISEPAPETERNAEQSIFEEAKLQKQVDILKERFAEEKAYSSTLESEYKELETRFRELEIQSSTKIRRLEQDISASMNANSSDAASLFKQYNEMAQRFDEVLAHIDDKNMEMDRLQKRYQNMKEKYHNRLQETENDLQETLLNFQTLQEKLTQLEQEYYHLLKSYRDLNDKMIRSKAGLPDKAFVPPPVSSENAADPQSSSEQKGEAKKGKKGLRLN